MILMVMTTKKKWKKQQQQQKQQQNIHKNGQSKDSTHALNNDYKQLKNKSKTQ